jgi:uncharacterized membrane protein YfcA
MFYVEILMAGLLVGVVFGVFGAGGSAFATPLLALLGVPGVAAVASPLPAMIPAAFAGARRNVGTGLLDRRIARLAVYGGVPGTVVGGLLSVLMGGSRLVFLSGLMLLVVGIRVLWPDPHGHEHAAAVRRSSQLLVVGASFAVGLLTGLLANGGGFLLVPLFIVVLGLSTGVAAGTSMVVVGALTIPTLLTHAALGHVDWRVAAAFAAGLVPASIVGTHLAPRIPTTVGRRVFGAMLVLFAAGFLVHQIL